MDKLEIMERKLQPKFDAIILVLASMRERLGLEPEDFRVAFTRVNEGSDGTEYQDDYVALIKHLIGSEP